MIFLSWKCFIHHHMIHQIIIYVYQDLFIWTSRALKALALIYIDSDFLVFFHFKLWDRGLMPTKVLARGWSKTKIKKELMMFTIEEVGMKIKNGSCWWGLKKICQNGWIPESTCLHRRSQDLQVGLPFRE